jgi:ABC-type enterochelin transport system substrate-binding protein
MNHLQLFALNLFLLFCSYLLTACSSNEAELLRQKEAEQRTQEFKKTLLDALKTDEKQEATTILKKYQELLKQFQEWKHHEIEVPAVGKSDTEKQYLKDMFFLKVGELEKDPTFQAYCRRSRCSF